MPDVTTRGKVIDYTLRLEADPMSTKTEPDKGFYFEVTIKKDDGVTEVHRIKRSRIIKDCTTGGQPYSVTWANASMAVIATFKDALLHNKTVEVTGDKYPKVPSKIPGAMVPDAEKYNSIYTVKIIA